MSEVEVRLLSEWLVVAREGDRGFLSFDSEFSICVLGKSEVPLVEMGESTGK